MREKGSEKDLGSETVMDSDSEKEKETETVKGRDLESVKGSELEKTASRPHRIPTKPHRC